MTVYEDVIWDKPKRSADYIRIEFTDGRTVEWAMEDIKNIKHVKMVSVSDT